MRIALNLQLNKYAQGLIDISAFLSKISGYGPAEKRAFINDLVDLIIQSKPEGTNLREIQEILALKKTPAMVILLQGITKANLQKILEFNDQEMQASINTLLVVYKDSYMRRYLAEKNSPDKWWYWDLRDEKREASIKRQFSDYL